MAAIHSMTGFARTSGDATIGAQGFSWVWEVKSLNARGLDVKVRVPGFLADLDLQARKLVSDKLSRGSVSVSLTLRGTDETPERRVNNEVLDQMVSLARSVARDDGMGDVDPVAVLALPGVIELAERELGEEDIEKLNRALLASLGEALDGLIASRQAEGIQLADMVTTLIDEIADATQTAAPLADKEAAGFQDRLAGQLDSLAQDIPVERLAQEAALLAVKADVREEIDRLRAHLHAARDLLANGGAVGRKLDFLTQEFNREANTLCSKAQSMDLKNIGLQLKSSVDQMREQIQNVE